MVSSPQANLAYSANSSLSINAQLMFGSDPMSPGPKQDFKLKGLLLGPDGNLVGNPELSLQANGSVTGTINITQIGTYHLQVTMNYVNQVSGENFLDVTEIPFTITEAIPETPISPSPTAIMITATIHPTSTTITFSPTPILASTSIPVGCGENCPPNLTFLWIILVILLLGGGGAAYGWWSSLPILSGSLDGDENSYRLKGKRPMTLGSDPRNPISIAGEGVLPKHAVVKAIGSRKNPRIEIRCLNPEYPININGIDMTFQILQNEDKILIGDQKFIFSGSPTQDLDLRSTTSSSTSDSGDWNF
jgi:hypothetical protein